MSDTGQFFSLWMSGEHSPLSSSGCWLFFLFTLAFLSDDNPYRIHQYYLLVFRVLAFGFAVFLFLSICWSDLHFPSLSLSRRYKGLWHRNWAAVFCRKQLLSMAKIWFVFYSVKVFLSLSHSTGGKKVIALTDNFFFRRVRICLWSSRSGKWQRVCIKGNN